MLTITTHGQIIMTDQNEFRSASLKQCSEDLLLTIPRLAHCFRPHGNFALGDGSHLSIGQGRLLMGINCGVHTVSELAEAGSVSLPTISRKIDLLVDKGLVSRKVDPDDRRAVILEITGEGSRTLQSLRAHANKQLSKFLASLSDDELEKIRESLQLLRRAFCMSEHDLDICP
jgi:DNA-binding MarR family transcriptional regulator